MRGTVIKTANINIEVRKLKSMSVTQKKKTNVIYKIITSFCNKL